MGGNSWHRVPDESPSASDVPGLADSIAASSLKRRGKHWRSVAVALVVLVIVVSAATARLFIWPDRGMPARVSAIVMLNGTGDRLEPP